jgi:hypothetical protein
MEELRMATDHSYVGGRYLLELDNVEVGFVQTVAGGSASAEVITEGAPVRGKHVGKPKYDDIVLTVGLPLPKRLSDWIASAWKGGQIRPKNGVVHILDYDLNERARRKFSRATLVSTTMPACDVTSREPGAVTVCIRPESVADAKPAVRNVPRPQKVPRFVSSNFRFEIEGHEAGYVEKIDEFTIQHPQAGSLSGPSKAPAEVPNLRVQIASSDQARRDRSLQRRHLPPRGRLAGSPRNPVV